MQAEEEPGEGGRVTTFLLILGLWLLAGVAFCAVWSLLRPRPAPGRSWLDE